MIRQLQIIIFGIIFYLASLQIGVLLGYSFWSILVVMAVGFLSAYILFFAREGERYGVLLTSRDLEEARKKREIRDGEKK